MKVVIFTDGSMRNGICGWAAHIEYEGQKHLFSGKSPRFVKSSAQAEIYAVLKAIRILKTLEKNIEKIHVYSDLLSMGEVVQPKGKRTKNTISKTLQDKIVAETYGAGIRLSVFFVRGHQKRSKGKAARMNNLVDCHAKIMRKKNEEDHSVIQKNKVLEFFEFLSFKYETTIFTDFLLYLNFLKIY